LRASSTRAIGAVMRGGPSASSATIALVDDDQGDRRRHAWGTLGIIGLR